MALRAAPADTEKTESRFDDDEWRVLCQQEDERSIGFRHANELSAQREKALDYYKGDMPDLKPPDNRSGAVSTDVADAIETVLPDLIEIFTGGDDVASFTPHDEQDEEAAKQETDFITHVVFSRNDGFLQLYTGIKDSLLEKTGLFYWYWQEDVYAEEQFEGKNAIEVELAAKSGEIVDLVPDPPAEQPDSPDPNSPQGLPTYSFTLKRRVSPGCARIQAVPPDDFCISADAPSIREATYHAFRSRPRAQELIAQGVDPDIVAQLHATAEREGNDTGVAQARDMAGESEAEAADSGELRSVEVVTSFLRIDADGDGKPELWQIRTGNDFGVLIDKERISGSRMSALTPYINTHRFHGLSVADKLLEIQRIKTVLLRMGLDSAYFALNQRVVVADQGANDFTIDDLLLNEPGRPIRVKDVNAIEPLAAGSLNYDVFGALEYVSTMAEQRTGIVRNAQGLNPDTLHDTAKGALALMTAAQKRVRLIARIFAETGLKDLFLGVHALIRENATAPAKYRLRNKWVPIDPSQWAERNDMTIEIGLGASGREQEQASLQGLLAVMTQIVGLQQGVGGPFVMPNNVYNLLTKLTETAGLKNPERYWTDPGNQVPQQPQDPNAAKAAQELQIAQIKAQSDLAAKKYQADVDSQTKVFQIQQEIAAKLRIAGLDSLTDIATKTHSARLHAAQQINVGGEPG